MFKQGEFPRQQVDFLSRHASPCGDQMHFKVACPQHGFWLHCLRNGGKSGDTGRKLAKARA